MANRLTRQSKKELEHQVTMLTERSEKTKKFLLKKLEENRRLRDVIELLVLTHDG